MSGDTLFFGDPSEDAELFLANFYMALHIKRVLEDQDQLEMFKSMLWKDAKTWFKSLPIEVKGNYQEV